MGMLVSFMIIGFYSKIWRFKRYLVILLILGVGIVSLRMAFPRLNIIPGGNITARVFSLIGAKKDPAMVPRYDRWKYFYEMSLRSPLTGLGTVVSESTREHFSDDAPTPHNTYLSLAVRRGYIALGIVLIIVLKTIFAARRLYQSFGDNYIKGLSLGAFSGMVGLFGVSGIFDPYLEDTQVHVLFWFIVAMILRWNYLTSLRHIKNSQISPNLIELQK